MKNFTLCHCCSECYRAGSIYTIVVTARQTELKFRDFLASHMLIIHENNTTACSRSTNNINITFMGSFQFLLLFYCHENCVYLQGGVFLHMTSPSSHRFMFFQELKVDWIFGGKRRLQLQRWRVSQTRNQHEAGSKQNLEPYLGLFCANSGSSRLTVSL
jgi:hypothetical protein